MTLAEAIETTRIRRVAGLTGERTALVTTRPCRSPYHTISNAGVIIRSLVKDSRGSLGRKLALSRVCMGGGRRFFTSSRACRHD
jgi:hypothetical protein